MKEFTGQLTLLEEYGGDGAGQPIDVKEWDEIWIQVLSRNSAELTLKFLGSGQEDAVDFNGDSVIDNHYDALSTTGVDSVELSNAGILISGEDISKIYKIRNSTGLRWLGARVYNWVVGDVTVKAWGIKLS